MPQNETIQGTAVNLMGGSLPKWGSPIQSSNCQVWLDGLNLAATTFVKLGYPPATLVTTLADYINAAQQATGETIKFKEDDHDGIYFVFETLHQSDWVKVQKPNNVRLLHSKIGGITIQVNLSKQFKYHHTNYRLAQSLRRLANFVDQAQHQLADQDFSFQYGNCYWY